MHVIGTLRTAVMAALLLAAGNSWALGLGQIQVKSKRNQPLLAEIPIVSTTPGELAALQARLASPETFRRVGLAPPSGIASDLQFSLGSDAKGRPIIRVTTLKPVEQSMLNFLIEVDWGSGRLVREYSALVDAPNTAGETLQPVVQMPQAPTPNLVQRPVEPPVAAAPATPEVPPAPPVASRAVEQAPPPPVPAPAEPRAPVADIAPQPQPLPPMPAPPASVPSADAPPASPSQYGPVKHGETLSKIASGLELRNAFSLDQTMLALLRANPDAFLGDDVNRLRSGAVLRVPTSEDVASIDPGEAAQTVRQQMRQWQQGRRAVRQPEAAASATSATSAAVAEAKPAEDTPKTKPSAPAAADAKPAPATPARRQEARLQIVPPSAPGKATGMKSGDSVGGEGSMLQQELRRRDEDIAAKSAEIGELKERLAALEKLKDEQQQLISLKDSELAAAQARLAEANKAGAQAAAPTKAETQATPAANTEKGASPLPYVWGGIGVVVLALLAWLLAGRRKSASTPVRRSVFDSEALAASMAAPVSEDQAVADIAEETVTIPEAEPAMEEPAAAAAAPAWHSSWVKVAGAAGQEAPPAVEPQPAVEEAAAPGAAEAPAQATPEQRFKLVRAFLDEGDEFSAQQLLLELLDDKDEAVSDEAARMLSKLVG